MPTLYIIDGYAQFFRAYHAIRNPMTSPVTKEPTNMTYGFTGMLLKLLRGAEKNMEGPPDYLVVALDVSGDRGTFRSQIYPAYKATRPEPPEDLFPQVERCLAMLQTLGVPIIGAEGFEADDVIASIVDRLRHDYPDLKVRIVSKDKDLKQLLADTDRSVELYDIHKDEVINVQTLKEESGITPAQVIDMLALMGDTVDNVPGVEGVGPKTAAQLIAQYETLDNLLAHADEIKGKRGEKLREAAPRLPLSRELVTLRHDVDIQLDLTRAETRALDAGALFPIFNELGFNSYQDQLKAMLGHADEPPTPAAQRAQRVEGGLFDQLAPEAVVTAEGDYRCVATRKQLEALVKALDAAPVVSVDTETTSISPTRADLCGLSFSIESGQGWYVPVRSPDPGTHLDAHTALDALRPILEDPAKPKYGHNLKYDLIVLRRAGVELRGLENKTSCDSLVSSFLIDSTRSSHSLDALALALLGRTNISIKDLIGSGKNQRCFDTVDLDKATPYAAEDTDVSLQLCEKMLPQVRAMGLGPLFDDVEMPLVSVLAELEYNGILVDPDELDRQRDRLQQRIDELRAEIDDAAMDTIGRTFNPDSPKQLAGALFNKPEHAEPGLAIKPLKKTKTGFSTDVEVLEKLAADPGVESTIPALIVEHRQLTKLVGTYLVALKEEINPQTRRIHASFHQTGAATGRLSSSDPNLQNIPIRTDIGREIRKAFVAPPGRVLISADYSQIELRLLAHLSKDPALIEAFEQGQDIHRAVAAQIHNVTPDEVTREQRNGAKMVNFGIVYGITPFGLARRLGVSNTEADEIITGYKTRFAGITTFLQECIDQARRHAYVETMLKRRRNITDIDSNNPQRRALAERVAINSVVQGSAADMIKIAMVDLHKRLSPHAAHLRDGAPPEIEGVRMLLQIHDELVFEADEASADAAKALIVERMQRAMDLRVPLVVDASVASNWFEGK
jgi:DNA polymerase-1